MDRMVAQQNLLRNPFKWFILFSAAACISFTTQSPEYLAFKDALIVAETGSITNKFEKVPDGDDGSAIGVFQIHYAYWLDTVGINTNRSGVYEKCRDYKYASSVVDSYLMYYASNDIVAGNWERLARIHNGGPSGVEKEKTGKFWLKVKKALNERTNTYIY